MKENKRKVKSLGKAKLIIIPVVIFLAVILFPNFFLRRITFIYPLLISLLILLFSIFLLSDKFMSLRETKKDFVSFMNTLLGTILGVLIALGFTKKYEDYKEAEVFKKKIDGAIANIGGYYMKMIPPDSAVFNKLFFNKYPKPNETIYLGSPNSYFDINLPQINYLFDFILNEGNLESRISSSESVLLRNQINMGIYLDGLLRGKRDSITTMRRLYPTLVEASNTFALIVVNLNRLKKEQEILNPLNKPNDSPAVLTEYNEIIRNINNQ